MVLFGGKPGAAVLALLTSKTPISLGGEDYLGVLIPSAPVPFGGALVYVPAAWIEPAEGGIDELMSVYVSMGITPPGSQGDCPDAPHDRARVHRAVLARGRGSVGARGAAEGAAASRRVRVARRAACLAPSRYGHEMPEATVSVRDAVA